MTKEKKAGQAWEPTSRDWDKEAKEHLKPEIDFLLEMMDKYGGDRINEYVRTFSSGILKDTSDLNPLNIRAFASYVKNLEEEAAKEDQDKDAGEKEKNDAPRNGQEKKSVVKADTASISVTESPEQARKARPFTMTGSADGSLDGKSFFMIASMSLRSLYHHGLTDLQKQQLLDAMGEHDIVEKAAKYDKIKELIVGLKESHKDFTKGATA